MAVLSSTLKLTLLDQVSSRAKMINRSLDGLQRSTHGMLAMTRNLAFLGASYFGITEGIDATYSAASKMQASLEEIGIKAGIGEQHLAAMKRQLVALSPQVNQSTTDLLAGIDAMVTLGLATEKAQAALPAIAKAATATGASIADLSGASTSAIQNLKVAPEEITKILDAMTLAGNAGAFEMRDMAKAFPQLTSAAQALGIQGVDGVADLAAALQIARRGAGDASTAANNLANFMDKIMSPDVIKNFKKFGVDVTKELKKAKKDGISPIERFIKLVDEKTNGGDADLIGQLFGDKQAKDFIRPMIADFKDYIKIREDAERASGTVDAAFVRRMGTNAEKVKSFRIAMENLGESVGANLLTPVANFADKLSGILNTLDQRATVFDRIGASLQGFLNGLGLNGMGDLGKSLEEFIFGVKDGSKAADELGRIFAKFQGWGRDVREFGEQVKDNPLVKFFSDLSPYAWSALKWSVGIAVLAGAVRKLAGAMLLLSGASTLISILKAAGSVTGLLGGGKVPGAVPTKTPSLPTVPPYLLAWGARLTGWTTAIFSVYKALDSVPHAGTESASKNDPEWFAKREAYRRQFGDVQFEGGMHRAGLGAGPTTPFKGGITNWPAGYRPMTGTSEHDGKMRDDHNIGGGPPIRTILDSLKGMFNTSAVPTGSKSVTIDQASIAAMVTPRGTQSVRVENQQRPNVTVNNSIVVNGVVDPKAAASNAASQIGEKVRSAVESANTD